MQLVNSLTTPSLTNPNPQQPNPSIPNLTNQQLTPQLTTQRVLEEYIAAEGKIELTAERLKTTPQTILKLISEDPAALQNVIRTFLLLTVFQSVTNVGAMLQDRLTHLEPGDLAKTYTSLVTQLSNLTAAAPPAPVINVSSSSTLNVDATIYNNLPPQARKALQILNEKTYNVAQAVPIIEDDDD